MRKVPVVLTDEMIDVILDRIADGESLRTICTDNPDLPTREMFRRACRADPLLDARHTSAREEAAHGFAGEIVHIADTEPDPQIARNRIDARKWVASKMGPKHYGERQKVDVSVDVADMTDDAITAELVGLVGLKVSTEK